MAVYLLSGWFFNSAVVFIFVCVLAVFDFWVVKNVSGRYLVGLRWWSVLDDQGNEQWKFESSDEKFKASKVDSFFFWYGQIFYVLF